MKRRTWVFIVVGLLAVSGAILYSTRKAEAPAATGARPSPPAVQPPADNQFAELAALCTEHDLSHGEYIVGMLSASCDHCEEDLSKLSNYERATGLPPVMAFMLGDADSLAQIRGSVRPEIPMQQVAAPLFFKLIGAAPPRVYLLEDGRPVRHWDEKIPEVQELLDSLRAPVAAPAAS